MIIQQLVGYPLAVGWTEVNPQDIVYPISGWFYAIIIILSLLFLLGIFAWARGRIRKNKEKKGILNKVISSFDYEESMKIFAYKHNYLNIFNGIKTISMLWVIFGHLFSVRLKND